MPWADFLAHFHSVDVCKAHAGWHAASVSGAVPAGGGCGAAVEVTDAYLL